MGSTYAPALKDSVKTMQVGFRDLTIWSFLMASAHGAGFMRLGRAASAALASTAGSTEPCPTEFARSALPADAEWFTGLADGVPAPTAGTAWMRDPAIVAAASAADPQQAMIALDREFGDASAIAVIHATSPATTGDERQFQGYVQLIGYPDGETMCTVAFHAQGADGSAFQSSFWAAEEAALGK